MQPAGCHAHAPIGRARTPAPRRVIALPLPPPAPERNPDAARVLPPPRLFPAGGRVHTVAPFPADGSALPPLAFPRTPPATYPATVRAGPARRKKIEDR